MAGDLGGLRTAEAGFLLPVDPRLAALTRALVDMLDGAGGAIPDIPMQAGGNAAALLRMAGDPEVWAKTGPDRAALRHLLEARHPVALCVLDDYGAMLAPARDDARRIGPGPGGQEGAAC